MNTKTFAFALTFLFSCTAAQKDQVHSGTIDNLRYEFKAPAKYVDVNWGIKGVVKSLEEKNGNSYFSVKVISLDSITEKDITTETITIESVRDDLLKAFKTAKIQSIDTSSYVGSLKAAKATLITGPSTKELKRTLYFFYFQRYFFVLSGGVAKGTYSKDLEVEYLKFKPALDMIVSTFKLSTE